MGRDHCPPHKRRVRRGPKRRLYWQIYLTFLAVAFFSLLAAGVASVVLGGQPEADPDGAVTRVLRYVGDDLPAAGSGLGQVLDERAARLGFQLSVYGADGDHLASTHDQLPAPEEGSQHFVWARGRAGPGASQQLSDGRWLVVRAPRHGARPQARGLLVLLVLFGATAVGCHPIARRLSRRLERLQQGVEHWGEGELSARVPVAGHDEVAELARSFNQAAERIEHLVEGQRRMLASASHELRSPLTRLRMVLELLGDEGDEDDDDDDEDGDEGDDGDGDGDEVGDEDVDRAGDGARRRARRAYIEGAAADIDELDALVGDLLLTARLDSDGHPGLEEDVDLLGIVAEEAARAGVAVDGVPTSLRGDSRALRRAVRNLVENARKHGGDGPIEVALQHADGLARLAVSDRGPGVDESLQERVFEPFFRADGHREGVDGGVGLGLALVRSIARAHGGEARVEARPGGGSCFLFEVPLV